MKPGCLIRAPHLSGPFAIENPLSIYLKYMEGHRKCGWAQLNCSGV